MRKDAKDGKCMKCTRLGRCCTTSTVDRTLPLETTQEREDEGNEGRQPRSAVPSHRLCSDLKHTALYPSHQSTIENSTGSQFPYYSAYHPDSWSDEPMNWSDHINETLSSMSFEPCVGSSESLDRGSQAWGSTSQSSKSPASDLMAFSNPMYPQRVTLFDDGLSWLFPDYHAQEVL